MSDTLHRIIEASRPTDADIDAEFTPAAQARILEDIIASGNVVPLASRQHSRRWVGLVAAGVVVAVGGLTVQALLPTRTTTVVTQDPSGGVTTVTVTQPPVGLPAAAALEPIAKLAETRPTATGTAFLHVMSTWKGSDGQVATSDGYTAADGWTWRKDVNPGQTVWFLTEPFDEYKNLPTDPVALDKRLRAAGGTNSGDERVFKALTEILMSQQSPPAVHAAAIRVLDTISKHPQAPVTTKDKGPIATPKVALELATVDGRAGVKATFTDATSHPGEYEWVVLDSTTGALIQSGTGTAKGSGASTVTSEIVDTLPAAFVTKLGTARVSKAVDG
jgi:hypothetical protein